MQCDAMHQVGTMFATLTHPGKAPEGPQLLAAIAAALAADDECSSLPLIGVGGITEVDVLRMTRNTAPTASCPPVTSPVNASIHVHRPSVLRALTSTSVQGCLKSHQ